MSESAWRPQPGEVVLECGRGAGWLRLRDPLEQLTAAEPADVAAVLGRLETAVAGGLWAAGFLAYEAAPGLDPVLVTRAPGGAPLCWFGLYRAAEPWAPPETRAAVTDLSWRPELAEADHARLVGEVRDRIARGETYQTNLTFRMRTPFAYDPARLAPALWSAQRGGYGALCHTGGHVVLSASPELFFRLDGRTIISRPMKGTRPRGRAIDDDRLLATALAASEKDRAENLMIVDMIRNDLGRIAETGSVRVTRPFQIERFPTVWQMTSTVEARTDASPTELLGALFPCASVTGAPKVRTMRIIRDLERSPRGVYCGSIGYLAPGRRAQFNVAIRTLTVDLAARTAEYGVGGGVVWDSTAAGEWAECEAKSRVLRPDGSPDLLETLLWEPGSGYYLLAAHLRRLARSAAALDRRIDLPAVRAALEQAARGHQPLRVRLTVGSEIAVTAEAAPRPRPFRVALAGPSVDSADRRLYHKTTDRALYEAAARSDCDDVLLHNERGELTESTIANLVLRLDGRLVTPPVACGLLPGVQREELLARGEIAEQVLALSDLDRAEEVWLVNSVRRWIPVRLLR